MTIPDKWKRPPMQAEKEDKQLSQEELVAKLLSTGLARSSMEAKQMAQSMLHVEKTQKQFETEIQKSANAPRQQKTVNAQDLVGIAAETVDGAPNRVANNVSMQGMTDDVTSGISKSQALLIKDFNSLKDHVARQQQTLERLEQDVAFIRSLLQNTKGTGTDESLYPRTPTASELLNTVTGAEKEKETKNSNPQSSTTPISFDSDDDIFITPNK